MKKPIKKPMKKPKIPENLFFWMEVIKNENDIETFTTRGNARQKRNLKNARKYKKWLDIQNSLI